MKKIALLAMLMLAGCNGQDQQTKAQKAPAEIEAPFVITCTHDWGLHLTGRDLKDFFATDGYYHIYTMDGYEAWVPTAECYIRTTKQTQEKK